MTPKRTRLGRPATYRQRGNGLIATQISVADWLALRRLAPESLKRRGTRWLVQWAVKALREQNRELT